MSGIINKVKAKIDEVKAEHSSNTTSTNAGPHNSNAANKADPRVDSDLDGSRNAGMHSTTHTTHATTGTGLTGTGVAGTTGAHHGHHDHHHNTSGTGLTGTGVGGTTGTHHHTTTTGTGVTGTSGIGSSGANTTAGPHSSNMANKLDPRVDSDLSGGHPGSNAGYTAAGTTGPTGSTFGTTGHTGHTGTGSTYTGTSTNAGPHSSNAANALDPRVDSDLDGSRNAGLNSTTHSGHHTTTTGLGHNSGNTTAGPHSSSLANKLDPRVDSDLSGGHPGSNAQYTATGTTGTHGTGSTGDSVADPSQLDAAHHGPTAFKNVHGDPSVQHEFPADAAHGRHGSIGKSDQHYGSGVN